MKSIESQIQLILALAKPGDILHVRSSTFFGFWIRRMLSLGLYRCWGNHNAPVYKDDNGELKILQIEAPSAYEMSLADYLRQTLESGGLVLLLRPDVLCKYRLTARQRCGIKLATERWQAMIGTPYDKRGVRMFLRMVFRQSAHIEENTKDRMYCTEGTLDPIAFNSYIGWNPDTLKNEAYPAPIHVEHLIRQERLVFVAGDDAGLDQIISRV